MVKKEQVLDFIDNFTAFGPQVEACFLYGNCYWFADILVGRFLGDTYQSRIFYNDVDNHFAAEIDGKLYDISGEIERNSHWVNWFDYLLSEPLNAKRVERDCIRKEHSDD